MIAERETTPEVESYTTKQMDLNITYLNSVHYEIINIQKIYLFI